MMNYGVILSNNRAGNNVGWLCLYILLKG